MPGESVPAKRGPLCGCGRRLASHRGGGVQNEGASRPERVPVGVRLLPCSPLPSEAWGEWGWQPSTGLVGREGLGPRVQLGGTAARTAPPQGSQAAQRSPGLPALSRVAVPELGPLLCSMCGCGKRCGSRLSRGRGTRTPGGHVPAARGGNAAGEHGRPVGSVLGGAAAMPRQGKSRRPPAQQRRPCTDSDVVLLLLKGNGAALARGSGDMARGSGDAARGDSSLLR